MADSPAITWITSDADLQASAQRCVTAPWLALDTESNSRFVYRERICLVQLNFGENIELIDPFELGPDGINSLAQAVNNPEQPLYLHGGEYDVACLKRDTSLIPSGVWDTQQAASLLGLKRTGYGALVEDFLEVHLAKEHSLHDWGQRPIDEAAVSYAADDVRYLPDLVANLKQQITAADLDEEMQIANQAVESVSAHQAEFDPAAMYRMKGIGRLHDKQLGLLTALYAWRDQIACEADHPPGRVVNNEALLHLARSGPTNFSSLKRIRMPGRILREHGEALLQLIQNTRDNPPTPPTPPARREPDPSEKPRAQKLKNWRRSEAERRGVTLQAVLPARAVEFLTRQPNADFEEVPQMGAKRIGLYGDTLRELLTQS